MENSVDRKFSSNENILYWTFNLSVVKFKESRFRFNFSEPINKQKISEIKKVTKMKIAEYVIRVSLFCLII